MEVGAPYEPIIVKTLRRYWRRGASERLLVRLAGGPRDWRLLNEWWNIDGRGMAPPPTDEVSMLPLSHPLARLSADERRIALAQMVDDCVETRHELPTRVRLGTFFGVTRSQIGVDLGQLRAAGRIAADMDAG